jgi:FkbM family methyltransferase
MKTLSLVRITKVSPLATLAYRMHRYAEELIFCLLIGVNLSSKLRLLLDTLRFHISNHKSRNCHQSLLQRTYSVRLGKRIIDICLRIYSGDIFIFHEVFLHPCYIIPQIYLSQVTSIVDLGANIGLTTIFFAAQFPEARCVCVEPDASNLQILKQNLAWLEDRVQIVEGAVSDRSGPAMFDTSGWSWGGHLSGPKEAGQPVQCYTIDEILASSGMSTVDIVKIDIEGAEKLLFSGNNDWLQRVRVIIIELHGDYSEQDFQNDMREAGFTVFPPDRARGNRMLLAVSNSAIGTS